jgi:hypothetical protein
MFCVPSVGTNFHKQNSAFLGFTNLVRGVCYAFLELAFCIYFNFVYQIFRVAPKIKIQRG